MKRYDGLNNDEITHAFELHKNSIVINCSAVIKQDDEHFNRSHIGGITAHNHTVTRPNDNLSESIKSISNFLYWAHANEQKCLIVKLAKDIIKAKNTGKIAFILGPQNAKFLEDISLIHCFKALGVRILQLTYQYKNQIGDGCGERTDNGLSEFGINLIEEMNKIGILIDLSHVGRCTTFEAIEISKDPIIFSHSHPYRLNPHIRNKTDEQIKAMSEKGGVIGITKYSPICELKSGVRPDVEDYMKHIDYVVELAGIDHVGIGLDFNEPSTPEIWASFASAYPELSGGYTFSEKGVKDLDQLSKVPNITKGLVGRGYSDQEIKKILGLNFLKVFKKVWGS